MMHCKYAKIDVSIYRRVCIYILHVYVYSHKLTLSFNFAAMLLLPCSRILKPNLRDSFAQTSYMSYSFEILTVGIAVQLEIRLQDRKLLLGKRCPYALCFAAFATVLGITVLRRGSIVTLDYVQIMCFTEQSGIQKGKLFTRRKLSRTGIAGEASQMINPFSGSSYPIPSTYTTSAFRTFGSKSSENTKVRSPMWKFTWLSNTKFPRLQVYYIYLCIYIYNSQDIKVPTQSKSRIESPDFIIRLQPFISYRSTYTKYLCTSSGANNYQFRVLSN